MKARRINAVSKGVLVGILISLIMISCSAYAKKIPFLKSTVVPAAEGYVKVKTDKNNNYVIKLNVSNLAEVERLEPQKQTYVVWMVTKKGVKENIGRINSSNNLNVSFETVSSYQPVQIFITAEVNESVQSPGEMIVLTTEKFWNNSPE